MASGIIQNATQSQPATQVAAKKSITTMLNSLLDSEGYRKRFNELLGARTPQFVSSIVSLVNADQNLQKAFYEAPITVVQSALKAATFNLPIDPNLGYAYIVPFNNRVKDQDGRSPSVWRVWIEICYHFKVLRSFYGHPPCGGCGLKCLSDVYLDASHLSFSVRKARLKHAMDEICW